MRIIRPFADDAPVCMKPADKCNQGRCDCPPFIPYDQLPDDGTKRGIGLGICLVSAILMVALVWWGVAMLVEVAP